VVVDPPEHATTSTVAIPRIARYLNLCE